jgi:hypothetical protein
MSLRRQTPATEPGPRLRDWTCWASALLIALMLLAVLACGGVFLYQLSQRHEMVSFRGEGSAIFSLQLGEAQPSTFVR